MQEIIIAIISSSIIGVIIGLLGAGGSILIMPMLVYVLKMPANEAVTYSLGIVGITSFISMLQSRHDNSFHSRSFFSFGLPALSMTLFIRSMIMPNIPNSFTFGNHELFVDKISMIILALLMLVASSRMIKSIPLQLHNKASQISLMISGILIGMITGITGIGAGFLIVPSLVLLSGMTMRQAIFSSMILISCNTLPSFAIDVVTTSYMHFDTFFILLISSLLGSFFGIRYSNHINQDNLKKIFGIVIALIAFLILYKELS